MPSRSIISITILLLLAVSIAGQKKTRVVDGRVEISPEELELEREKYEKLKNPTFLTLELAEIADDPTKKSDIPIVYKVGSPITFYLLVTNTSAEPVELRFSDRYNHHRPQLLKEGQLVPYQEKVLRLVRARDKEFSIFSDNPVLLDVNKLSKYIIALKEWYGSLEPGRYDLSVRHRFVWEGEWIESPSISFEVQPE
ncbi:MAG: hypothetical protein ACR2G4_18540 [Pyrinomonadaceae bacterium]